MRILILLSVVFINSYWFGVPAIAQDAAKKPVRTIIIDPGHGGMDPGAVGLLASEANVSLAVSLQLGDTIPKHFRI